MGALRPVVGSALPGLCCARVPASKSRSVPSSTAHPKLSYGCSRLFTMTELGPVHHSLLPADPPFSFACSLRAMSGFAPCSGDQLVAGGRVRKAFPHPADPA